MLGGVVLNTKPPLRYLQLMPGQTADQVLSERNIKETDFCELTYLWLHRSVTPAERFMVLHDALWKAFRTGKPLILAGTYAKSIAAHQMVAIRHLLYDGPGYVYGRQRRFWIYFVNRYAGLAYLYQQMIRSLLKGRLGIDVVKRRDL